MPLHPWLARAASRGALILLYGPPGSGKTSISLELARAMGRSCVVSTEAGTTLAFRHRRPPNARLLEVLAPDGLAPAVASCAAEGYYTIVDSANAFYRSSAKDQQHAAALALSAALLRRSAEEGVGGVMTAQVSLDGGRVPGWSLMAPWSTVIARLYRQGDKWVMEAVKPERLTAFFRVGGGGVEWL